MRQNSLPLQLCALAVVFAVWVILRWELRDILIYHDAWKHNFPELYGVSRNSACGHFAYWLTSPDTGSETIVFALNVTLTQPIRALLIALWACTRPPPFEAMMFYEFHTFAVYSIFAFGMFVLGRLIYQHWLTPVYIVATVLFAGIAVQMVHSDQYAMLVFWMPWCASAAVLAHRSAGTKLGAFYVNVMAACVCVALNDQEPHSAAFPAGCALVIYAAYNVPRIRAFASQWMHLWPSVLLLGVCLAGFLIIKGKIFEYLTSQHSQILPHPSTMGETGFVQPSTFLSSLFPLSLTSAYEEIRQGSFWRAYNFHLDVLIFYIGTLPFLLLLSLVPRGGLRGPVRGWAIFSLLMLLASMQKTQIYYALFHLPFFYLFRNYFFFFVFAVVGLMVLSGYGLDRLLRVSPEERRAVLLAALRIAVPLFAVSAMTIAIQKHESNVVSMLTFVAVASVLFIASSRIVGQRSAYEGAALRIRGWSVLGLACVLAAASILVLALMLHDTALVAQWKPIAGDAVILVVAFATVGWISRREQLGRRQGLVMIGVLVVTQSLYIVGAYGLVGESPSNIFARYKMSEPLLTPFTAAELANPVGLRRVPCVTNGSCFLAQRDAVSLNRDIDGTFLRQQLNPVFQDELSPATREALLTPMIWPSAGLKSVHSVTALNALVNANKADLDRFLADSTYVVGGAANAANQGSGSSDILIDRWEPTANVISFRYRAAKPGVINLGVANSPHWVGSLNGAPITLVSGNYGTVSLQVPAGEGQIVLRYEDLPSRLYFWSRWLMDLLAMTGIGFLIWGSRDPSKVAA